MKTHYLVPIILAFFLFGACSGNKTPEEKTFTLHTEAQQVKQSQTKPKQATEKSAKAEPTEEENPDLPYNTAELTTWKSYFQTNNKYKDWDSKDAKTVLIGATVDKEGKAHNVKVLKSCDVKELDEEAIRLIQEAPISPARNKDGKEVEQTNWGIPVYFPPK